MTSSQSSLYMFMLGMLVMGTVNMLMLKFQTMQKVPMTPGGPPEDFHHPVLQAGLMMVGELLCLPVYHCLRKEAKNAPPWIFLVPCCCDLIATTMLCIGLAYAAVSVAQMCRGSVVVFVCLLSFIFLGKRQQDYQLGGVALVTAGIGCVSSSVLLGASGSSSSHLLMGISFCIFAQVFQASMFVYEEKIMSQYTVEPLQVVGMEGLFGVCITAMLLLILSPMGYANVSGALFQISSSRALLLSTIGSMCAVAVFNACGANVTKRSSAVARTTVKMSTTIVIWFVELAAGWNTFHWLQLIGFAMVALGTLVYNRIIVVNLLEPVAEAKPFAKACETA